jgi:hypothetical protein
MSLTTHLRLVPRLGTHGATPPTSTYLYCVMFRHTGSKIMSHNVQKYPSLIPWSRVILGKLTVLLLVTKFSTFYETQRFAVVFTCAYHEQD